MFDVKRKNKNPKKRKLSFYINRNCLQRYTHFMDGLHFQQ